MKLPVSKNPPFTAKAATLTWASMIPSLIHRATARNDLCGSITSIYNMERESLLKTFVVGCKFIGSVIKIVVFYYVNETLSDTRLAKRKATMIDSQPRIKRECHD